MKEQENEKSINPKKLWIIYGVCIGLSIIVGLMPAEQQTIADLAAIINLPALITVLVALLCAPVRLIQAATKKDKRYLKAGLLCGLLPLTHILLATAIVAGNQ
ncbi:hypothetical protein ACWPKS_00920 [Coraliomargarita sp. W4R72]